MTNIDLSQLANDRNKHSGVINVKRRWFSRYALPGLILIVFAALLGWATRDSIFPSKAVNVVPVIVAKAEIQQSGTPLFNAAGWVEPRPIPIVVSSLAEGVIDELCVVAGEKVEKGQVIARLIDVDMKLVVATAQLA